MYVNQLERIASKFDIPLLDGSTNQKRREELYSEFRKGKIKRLVVSKVANNAVDLPDA
jgi:DNA excision repair protein ERCC-3